MSLSTVKWAQWDKTQSRELLGLFICVCSSLCIIQLLHTILHSTDLTIFPLALQTITVAPMMSIWGKGSRLYRAYNIYIVPCRDIQSAQIYMTRFYLQITPCMPFFANVHQRRQPLTEVEGIWLELTTHLLTRRDERLSWPGWLTYSGWFTYISCHPSATGRAQVKEVRRPKTDVLPLFHATNQCITFVSNYSIARYDV